MYDLLINNKLGEDSSRLTVPEMVDYLCEHLSPEVTSYLSGLDEPDTVRAWARGNVLPNPKEASRLEVAYKATQCLVRVCGDEMTRTWFFGMNRTLQNRAPAYALRHWSPGDRIFVLSAAEQFAEI